MSRFLVLPSRVSWKQGMALQCCAWKRSGVPYRCRLVIENIVMRSLLGSVTLIFPISLFLQRHAVLRKYVVDM